MEKYLEDVLTILDQYDDNRDLKEESILAFIAIGLENKKGLYRRLLNIVDNNNLWGILSGFHKRVKISVELYA